MRTIEETYVKTDLHNHILNRPDSYIGSIVNTTEERFTFSEGRIVKKLVNYNPGLIKIFDEILVNAIDHSVKNPSCTTIKVYIDQDNGIISVYNNGPGIPVVIHDKYKVFVPELIFGNLLTSSNYDPGEQKTVGGKNGLGSKLSSIYSSSFTVETCDSVHSYKQEFKNNMFEKSEPVVKKCIKNGYTLITFKPDYTRFGLSGLTDDNANLMKKRVYDCTACTNKNVSVYLNGEKIKAKEFIGYTQLYFDSKPLAYEQVETNGIIWEFGVFATETGFDQISFVNGIATTKGGKHVDCIVNQITTKLGDLIKTKKKIENVKSSSIKEQLFVFVRATIVNPDFDTQTKETLTTQISKFGIKIDLSDSFINKLFKSVIVENVISLTNFKNQKLIEKSSPNSSRKSKINVPKLDDANWAGTSKSNQCTLILTEGDSAKTFATSGLSVIGRDKYGIFALRGKVLNTREATQSQLLKNEEINNIKTILGLSVGKKVIDTSSLRYSSILILTDADSDGIHIRALLVNMISTWWPELLEVKGFIKCMKTPIVKITKGNVSKEFYTVKDFKDFYESVTGNWKVKYYKGLGTSTATEAKDLFKRITENTICYTSGSPKVTEKAILLAFEKKQAENRKEWLRGYDSTKYLDQSASDISYSDFINNELIHFSIYDVVRSIPSICDGLKPSQRKIMFTLFKKTYKSEIKVAQLAASVAETSGYHHGEVSLMGAIVNLAQNYTGSNNWNLLKPNGQFGTRLLLGKDSASPRYIFTELSEYSKSLFNKTDLEIVDYITEEGQQIEPQFYIPLLPLVLINGCQGIGTGYSTFIPSYNPKDIISGIKMILSGNEPTEMVPWYSGFTGKVSKISEGSYEVTGVYKKVDGNTIRVTEIPIGVSIEDYKMFLETFVETNTYGLVSMVNGSDEVNILFTLRFNSPLSLNKFLELGSDTYKVLKLVKNLSTRNMHLFDEFGVIQKYNTPEEILKDFVKVRMKYYSTRKDFVISNLSKESTLLKNKFRFISCIINGSLVVNMKSKSSIETELSNLTFSKVEGTFDYLLKLPVYSFTKEKIDSLTLELNVVKTKLNDIKTKTEIDIYNEDLIIF